MSEDLDLSHLNGDIQEIATKAKAVGEKNGELRSLIKNKLDGRGYEKKALGYLRGIAALSDDKFADFYRTFEPGLREVVGNREGQPEMDFNEAPEPTTETQNTVSDEEASDISDEMDAAEDEFEHDAFAQGVADFEAGVTRDGNPLSEMATAHLWSQGWDSAYNASVEGDAA